MRTRLLIALVLVAAGCQTTNPKAPSEPKANGAPPTAKPATTKPAAKAGPLAGCVAEDTHYNCPNGKVIPIVTVDEVLFQLDKQNNKSALLGKTVAVRGIVGAPTPRCTEAACSKSRPCCNTCTASLGLNHDYKGKPPSPAARALPLLKNGKPWTCGGTNCEVKKACAAASGPAVLLGQVAENSEGTVLELK